MIVHKERYHSLGVECFSVLAERRIIEALNDISVNIDEDRRDLESNSCLSVLVISFHFFGHKASGTNTHILFIFVTFGRSISWWVIFAGLLDEISIVLKERF
jgi:hypothetical protein